MKQNLFFLWSLLCGLAFTSCGGGETKERAATPVYVTQAVSASELGASTFTGRTKAATEVNLAFRVAGQIERMLVKEGDYVRQGQVVAEMDNRDYQVQLTAVKAEYEQVKADAERVMALYAEGNTTASNYDKARYGLQQMEQKLANCRNQLDDTRLRSTINGYVQSLYHQAGETVGQGMPVLSLFTSGDTEVEIKVSATDYVRLQRFSSFKCRFDVTGDKTYPLSVSRVSQEANSSQLYTVRLRFADAADAKDITPGMTTLVYAEIEDGDGPSSVLVPTGAVVEEGAKTCVYVLDSKDSVVRRREVKVDGVVPDGRMTVSAGLKTGEIVVSSGAHHVTDGERVEVVGRPSSSNVGGLL